MKRTAIVCLLVALLAATLASPVDAAKPDPKKVTRIATYDDPAVGLASGTGGAACLPCPSFAVSAMDRWVEMEVDDETSPAPVAFEIRQAQSDGSCCDVVAGPFCGSTGKQPVELSPGREVLVFVFASGDVTCPGGTGTRGTVTAVFSNVR